MRLEFDAVFEPGDFRPWKAFRNADEHNFMTEEEFIIEMGRLLDHRSLLAVLAKTLTQAQVSWVISIFSNAINELRWNLMLVICKEDHCEYQKHVYDPHIRVIVVILPFGVLKEYKSRAP